MKELNVKNEDQKLERQININAEKNSVKNDFFVMHHIYKSKDKTQDGSLETLDDPHSVQRRRYFNTRRV